jgi:hypothetical protein
MDQGATPPVARMIAPHMNAPRLNAPRFHGHLVRGRRVPSLSRPASPRGLPLAVVRRLPARLPCGEAPPRTLPDHDARSARVAGAVCHAA